MVASLPRDSIVASASPRQDAFLSQQWGPLLLLLLLLLLLFVAVITVCRFGHSWRRAVAVGVVRGRLAWQCPLFRPFGSRSSGGMRRCVCVCVFVSQCVCVTVCITVCVCCCFVSVCGRNELPLAYPPTHISSLRAMPVLLGGSGVCVFSCVFLAPLTFARHRLSHLAAFTSGAYFLHSERR